MVEAPAALEQSKISKVLVADDSGVCRARLKAMCKRLCPGCEISCVNDGDEAVQDFDKGLQAGSPFDVVLMDLNMVGDDDRPHLTGMLDERNGPQATARIRRSEFAASENKDPAVKTRALVIVITGSTRTDRWDLAYYQGCGIDGFLQKPVSMKALTAAVQEVTKKATQRAAQRDARAAVSGGAAGATFAPGESPLFGMNSASDIDMYIDPELMEKVSSGDSPFAAIDALSPSALDGLSAYAGMSHVIHASNQDRIAQEQQEHEEEDDDDAALPGSSGGLAVPAGAKPGESPMPPPKHTQRMAPRLPRRRARHAPQLDEHEDKPPAPKTTTRAPGSLHFLLVNEEPLMLMLQTALVQSMSLDHSITRTGNMTDAIDKLAAEHRAVDVALVGPVTDAEHKVDITLTKQSVAAIREHEKTKARELGSAPLAVFAVTASVHVMPDSAAVWGVDEVLRMPLRKTELQAAMARFKAANTSADQIATESG
mmetsp:Transcript_23239/g.68488  ORF Transcript_23239/g.68488 Transcript_23239/m.68488 type:complete len:484 (-) Transcript_23239:539-1990(-)